LGMLFLLNLCDFSLIFNSFGMFDVLNIKIDLLLSGHITEKEFFVAQTSGQFVDV